MLALRSDRFIIDITALELSAHLSCSATIRQELPLVPEMYSSYSEWRGEAVEANHKARCELGRSST
jgi:hypothetical protein